MGRSKGSNRSVHPRQSSWRLELILPLPSPCFPPSLSVELQVYDQHLDFLVLSPSLFSLSPSLATPVGSTSTAVVEAPELEKSTYEKLNDPRASESDVEEVTDRIARGLFSVLVTMGQLPLIRAPRGNAAEMVARKLDAKLRDHVATTSRSGNLFSSASGGGGEGAFGRPRKSLQSLGGVTGYDEC